jgi:putative ABC transport system permease protein
MTKCARNPSKHFGRAEPAGRLLWTANMLRQNIRLAIRQFVTRPAFFGVVVLVIAIGVGANAAIFTIVDAVLLRPLPYLEPDRLVSVMATTSTGGLSSVSILNHQDVAARSRSLAAASLYGPAPLTLSDGEASEPLNAFRVSANLFSVLGVGPARGHLFSLADDRAALAEILLSDGLWRHHFGADPQLVGRTIRINGALRTVAGIMPPAFAFPEKAEAWVPLEITSDELRPNNRGAHFLSAIGRLKPGVSVAQARREVASIGEALAREYPEINGGSGATLAPAADRMVESARPALLFLLGAVGFVLLIACANVSNLMLTRAATRQQEIAMRTALGASRRQIIAQLLAESLVLAAASATAGLLLAAWIVRAAMAVMPRDLPHAQLIGVDGRVLAFTIAVATAAAIICGLAPALFATRGNLLDAIRDGRQGSGASSRSGPARRLLVAIEVALALILLVGAGGSMRSMRELTRLDPGFSADRVLSARIAFPRGRYTPTRTVDTVERLIDAIRQQHGVLGASAISVAPFEGRGFGGSFHTPDVSAPGAEPSASVRAIGADYFRTMSIPLLRGRAIDARDTASAPGVAVISAAVTRIYWADRDPIGRHLTLDVGVVPGPPVDREIVGIVKDVKLARLDERSAPVIYVPHAQYPAAAMTVVVKTAGETAAAVPMVRHELSRLDRDVSVLDAEPMSARIAGSSADLRFRTLLIAAFGAVALTLAVVGIYAVIAYSMTQRTHEIGVRIALGASPEQVMWLAFRDGMAPVAAGTAAGLAGAAALARAVSGLITGVSAVEPATVAAAAALLIAAALAACYVPARRALGIRPLIALRCE